MLRGIPPRPQLSMKMNLEIHRIPMGFFTNAYLIRSDEGTLLVDAGYPGHEHHFCRYIRRLGRDAVEPKLIVATHGHADHVGCLHSLKKQTGAKVAIHQADAHLVRRGTVVIPPAVTLWGRFLFILFRVLRFLGRFEPIEPDIVIERPFSLREFKIPGRLVPTPGHTPGSVSVVLDSGEAFVGDLAVNSWPLKMGLGIPSLAEDIHQIYASWEKILLAGATVIYPAHGKPFPAERLKEQLSGIRDQRSGIACQSGFDESEDAGDSG